MVSGDQAIVDQLCAIKNLLSRKENRDTKILTITIPELPTVTTGTRSFANGTTEIDFKLGTITDPDGTLTTFQGLVAHKRESEVFRSITIEPSQNVVLQVVGDPAWKYYCKADYSNQFTYLEYTKVRIITNQLTNIQIFACTNPEAVVSIFSKTTVTTLDQDVVLGDSTEATTWSAISSLKSNLNRIRNQIITITGEAWGTVSTSILTLWGKFNATTGHAHTGANNGAQINHANLANIGTNAHTTIDTHIAASTVHGITGSVVGTSDIQTLTNKTLTTPTLTLKQSITPIPTAEGDIQWDTDNDQIKIGNSIATLVFSDDSVNATTYAPIAKGVTNGDTHDHNGGDGAQINHTTLSNIGTNTHAQIDTAITNSTNHIAATSAHGASGNVVGTTTLAADIATHAALTTGTHGVGASTVESTSGSQSKVDTHAALTATHGATGAVVGTTNTQTLTNKTLTTPTLTTPIINGETLAIVTKVSTDSPYTVTATDRIILCDCTSGAITINLPASSGISGRVYTIKKIDSSTNKVTIDGNASETIDGELNRLLGNQNDSMSIAPNSGNWYII